MHAEIKNKEANWKIQNFNKNDNLSIKSQGKVNHTSEVIPYLLYVRIHNFGIWPKMGKGLILIYTYYQLPT